MTKHRLQWDTVERTRRRTFVSAFAICGEFITDEREDAGSGDPECDRCKQVMAEDDDPLTAGTEGRGIVPSRR